MFYCFFFGGGALIGYRGSSAIGKYVSWLYDRGLRVRFCKRMVELTKLCERDHNFCFFPFESKRKYINLNSSPNERYLFGFVRRHK